MALGILLSLVFFIAGVWSLSIQPSGKLMCTQLGQSAENVSSFHAESLTCTLQNSGDDRIFSGKEESFFTKHCRQALGKRKGQRGMKCMMLSRLQPVRRHLKHGKYMTVIGQTIKCKNSEHSSGKNCRGDLGKDDLSVKIVLREVVQNKQDVNCLIPPNYMTPLLNTARIGDRKQKEFDLLVCLGADINIKNKAYINPLLFAALEDERNTAEKLVKLGADVESRCFGKTVLLITADRGHIDLLFYLIGVGCNVNAVNRKNMRNVLHLLYAKQFYNVESVVNVTLIERLLEANFSKNNLMARDVETGKTPLLYAAQHCDLLSVKLLVQNGCNVSDVDKRENNILHFACRCCSLEMVKFITSIEGINVNDTNKAGKTPKDYVKESRKCPRMSTKDQITWLIKG